MYEVLRILLTPEAPSTKSFADLAAAQSHISTPMPMIVAQRFHFHRKTQGSNETIADFIANLRSLAGDPEFGT